MEKTTFDEWDPAEYIETKEDVEAFLEVALEDNDPAFLLRTMEHIARSKGMAQLIGDLGLPPETSPFTAMLKTLADLGFQLTIDPAAAPSVSKRPTQKKHAPSPALVGA
jgi:probable addiction module antidote protein